MASGDIEEVESFLLKAAVVSPASMNHICRIILNLQFRTKKISRQRIGKRFTTLAERNIEKGNLYEVIWLLYTLRGLKVSLRSKLISEMAEVVPSSALALVLLDMDAKSLCVHSLPKGEWVEKIKKAGLLASWMWLLAYEGIRHGWIQDPSKAMSDPFFDAMASRNVVFYDPRRNVPSSEKVVKIRKRSQRKQFLELSKIFGDLRGLGIGDY